MKRTALKRSRKPTSAAAKAFKKIKPLSVSALKKKADAATSLFVRQKYAPNGIAECYTCGKRDEWKRMQNGHFISRNNSATRYDLDNLRVQCAGCNVWGRGKLNIFADKLLKELGTKRFKALLARGRTTHQFTRQELEQIIKQHSPHDH
jgi:hypothetical protein